MKAYQSVVLYCECGFVMVNEYEKGSCYCGNFQCSYFGKHFALPVTELVELPEASKGEN